MEKNPENTYSWPTIKGWYKGIFFRSSYEYHFMKWLETQKISVLHDMHSNAFKIPYEFEGSEHTYICDFYVPKLATVYEIKSLYALENDPKVKIKANAASIFLTSHNIKYVIMTEREIPIPRVNSRDVISLDPCVFLLDKIPIDDTFSLLFSEQLKFMKLLQKERDFPEFPVDLGSKQGQKLVKDISHDCMHELFEAIHLLKNSKTHRKTDVQGFDRSSFLEELADVFHYLIEILIVSNISPEEIYKAYMKKGTINFARILDNY